MQTYTNLTALAAASPAGDVVCVDTEPANETRSSLCAIGVTVLNGGEPVAAAAELIGPRCSFNPFNTMINGISADTVAGARTLAEAWDDVATICASRLVVCHNAEFDISVLRSSAATHGLVGFPCEVTCTMRLARRVWPNKASYGLKYLSNDLGIPLDHHQAGSDALACAWIAVNLLRDSDAADFPTLHKQLEMCPGVLAADPFTPIWVATTNRKLANREPDPDADENHPLYGLVICFTGALLSMIRNDAAELVTTAGAEFVNTMSRRVDLLVVGDADFLSFADGHQTGKLAKAAKLREKGEGPEIVREADFFRMFTA